jgi:serine/threonine protein phosphatase PrpC
MGLAVAAGRTEKGPVRKTNDDAFRIYCDNDIRVKGRGFLFAVADGIGSYRAGGQAAQIAVDQLGLYFRYPAERFEGPQTVVDLVWRANDVITNLRTGQKEYYGMGCTLTAMLIDPKGERAIVYQVGDSMAYLLRDARLMAVTRPQQAEESGELANHLGLGKKMEIERVRFGLRPGDTVLLCSDGISGYVGEEAITAALAADREPQPCLDQLMERALESSQDNVTAVVVKIH